MFRSRVTVSETHAAVPWAEAVWLGSLQPLSVLLGRKSLAQRGGGGGGKRALFSCASMLASGLMHRPGWVTFE